MPSFNKAIIAGHVTRDIELKHTQAGTAVAELTLAVNEKRKDAKGEWIEDVSFIDCTLWGRTAEIAKEYLSKGSAALIEGRLKQDKWEDKETGAKRSKIKVIAERLVMLGSKGGGERQRDDEYSQEVKHEPAAQSAPADEEIPF